MSKWSYPEKFIRLSLMNEFAYYRKNIKRAYKNETVECDCLYLKDVKNGKWVEIIFDHSINDFVNIGEHSIDFPYNNIESDVVTLVGYALDVIKLISNKKE